MLPYSNIISLPHHRQQLLLTLMTLIIIVSLPKEKDAMHLKQVFPQYCYMYVIVALKKWVLG